MSRKVEREKRTRAEMLVIMSQHPIYTDSDTFKEAVRLAKSGEDCQSLPPELARYWHQMRGMFLRDYENLLRTRAKEGGPAIGLLPLGSGFTDTMNANREEGTE